MESKFFSSKAAEADENMRYEEKEVKYVKFIMKRLGAAIHHRFSGRRRLIAISELIWNPSDYLSMLASNI